MGLDHSNAFVTLRFDGLITFCINRREDPNSCVMGMVQDEDHERRLTVTRINPNGTEEVIRGPYPLSNRNEVIIETVEPVQPGARLYSPPPELYAFDAAADVGDPEDSRWILDLQGEKFHGGELRLKRGEENYLCRPRIFIPHGTFYTYSKTPHQYMRYARRGTTQPLLIGKVADKVGADIVCNPVSGKVVVDINAIANFTLDADGLRTRYRIDITNLCRPDCAETSDFPLYYRVAADNDGIEFDVRPLLLKNAPGVTKTIEEFIEERTGRRLSLPEFEKFGSNGPPQVCNLAFLSQTNTIP